jgi:Flp pilus assembly protein TadG
MSENNRKRQGRSRQGVSQAGAFAVEFALVIVAFLTFLFCVIEVARAMYLWNTLQEVTRRAASVAVNTDFTDVTANKSVREFAIFRNSPGKLIMGDPVTDAHIHIDYMSLERASDGKMTLQAISSGALPSSPARNVVACMDDGNSPNCIRFVRVRVCAPSSDFNGCDPVQYVPLFPLIPVLGATLPPSTTIARAETLGYEPGQLLGP